YQAAEKALVDARAKVTSGDTAREIAQIESDLVRLRQEDQSKDLNLRFVKSELEELRFKYDDALHLGHKTDDIAKEIADREVLRAERLKIYTESQTHIEELEGKLKTLRGSVKAGEDALAKLTTARDDLQQKLENVSLGYSPGPKATPPYFGSD